MKITICGYGWLGQPLADNLIQSGHTTLATKRNVSHHESLKHGLKLVAMTIGDPSPTSIKEKLFDCDTLIINIPPGRKSFQPNTFIENMCSFTEQAKQFGTQSVIFVSTTAVYGAQAGPIYETTQPQPVTDSAKAHVSIEKHIMELFPGQASILRLAGLVGGQRHPARHLAGRTGIEHGQQRVNLVHQQDVIKAISSMINERIFGETLHLCCSEHPRRMDYYAWAAAQLALPVPTFNESDSGEGKQINCDATLQKLGMTLTFPSPYDFPELLG